MGIKLKAIIGVLVLLLIGSWIFFLLDYDKGQKAEDNNYVMTISKETR